MDGYFHRPDALERALQSINPVIKAQHRKEIEQDVARFIANGGSIDKRDILIRRKAGTFNNKPAVSLVTINRWRGVLNDMDIAAERQYRKMPGSHFLQRAEVAALMGRSPSNLTRIPGLPEPKRQPTGKFLYQLQEVLSFIDMAKREVARHDRRRAGQA